jgi:hypothetical protein
MFLIQLDRDATLFLFRSVVDLIHDQLLGPRPRLGQHLGDRRRQRRLAVVHVTDRADVHMRLGPLEFLLCHTSLL